MKIVLTKIHLIIILYASNSKSYNFTENEWNLYYIKLILKHFLTFNIIIKYLEILI